MEDFKSVLEKKGLIDMGWRNQKFIGLTGTRTTKKRLDREVANRLWMEEFDCSRVKVLLSSRSNHQLIIITTRGKYSGKKGRKVFRFEAKWALDKEGE